MEVVNQIVAFLHRILVSMRVMFQLLLVRF